MADLSKIKLNGIEYDIKDTIARTAINNIPIKILDGRYTGSKTVTISSYITSKELYQTTGAVYLYIGRSTNQQKDIYRLVFKNYDLNDGEPLYQFCFVCISTSGIIQILQSGYLFGDKSQVSSLTYSTIIIPTTTSQITNDSGYITSYTETDPTVPAWAKEATKPSYTAAEVGATTISDVNSLIATAIGNINQFGVAIIADLPTTDIDTHTIYFKSNSSSGNNIYDEYMYINNNWELIGSTQIDLSNYLQNSDIAAWAKASTKPTYTASEVGALPDTTTIPTKTSDLTNDSGFITSYTEIDPVFTASAAAGISATDISNWNAKSNFSGSYNDLTNQPTIPEDKIFPINVTLTSLTGGTSDKTHTEIFNAVTNGKIPIVNTSFGSIKMIASLTHSSSEYAIFTYINQLDNSVNIKYTEMRIINNTVTLTNLVNEFALQTDIPTNISDLNNDSGFITATSLPTSTSDLTNDSGFVTNSDLPDFSTFLTDETDPVFLASAASEITSTDISNWNAKSDFSGSYNDLTDQPTIPPPQVQSDWNAITGMGVILNKPTIPAATTVTNTLASGTLIATINGTNIYAPAYIDADGVSY